MKLKLKEDVLDLIFPLKCVGCGAKGKYICDTCLQKIVLIKSQACPFCRRITEGGRLCKTCLNGHKLSGVVAVGYFHDPLLKEAIHQFKYEGLTSAKKSLALILGGAISLADINFDIITYTPISRRRRNERGYNQAKLLAQELSQYWGKPMVDGLIKKQHTKPQVGLKRKDRLNNLTGAFEVKPGLSLDGKKVLLIDDVLTTGATLDECARVLKSAGARQVWGAVLARE